jgi:hypothetical protein
MARNIVFLNFLIMGMRGIAKMVAHRCQGLS